MLEVRVLGSGSSGNALVLSCGQSRVLVDVGLPYRELAARMRAAGIAPASITAVLLTHEHDDHVKGLKLFLKHHKVPVFAAPECFETGALAPLCFHGREPLEEGRTVAFGRLEVTPFRVPHDAAATYGFLYRCDGVQVGHATDLGCVPFAVGEALKGCHCLLVEFNHDVDRLLQGSYPVPLKMRIRSDVGHLSNEQGARLLAGAAGGETRAVFLMHLSRHNNLPALALMAAREALSERGPRLEVALPGGPTPAWQG